MRWIVLVVLGVSAVAAAEETPPGVVSFGASEVDLVDGGATATVYVPVTPADGATVDAALAIDVIAVAQEGHYDAALKAGVTAVGETDDKKASWIKLGVPLASFHAHGDYQVTLRVATPDAKQFEPVTQAIKLKHATAKARVVPATVVIERSGFLPGMGAWQIPKVDLQELTGTSQLTPVVVDLHDGSADGEPFEGAIALTAPASVAAGKSAPLAVTVGGDIPNDTVTGKLELRAPQLEEGAAVSYELRTNVWPGTVVLVLAIGLVLGTLVKPRLYDRIDRLRWRREVVEIAKAASAFTTHADTTFAGAAKQAVADCLAAIKAPAATTTDRDKKRDALKKALDDAVADWRTRLAAAKTATLDRERIVTTAWALPSELRERFASIQTVVAAAREAVERGDAAGADEQLGKADTAQQGLAVPLANVKTSVRDVATVLENQPGAQATPWPSAPKAVAGDLVAQLRTLVDDIKDAPPGGDTDFAEWLAKVHALETAIALGAARMAASWQTVMAAARRELAELKPDPLATADATLPKLGDDPRGYLRDVGGKAYETVGAVRAALLQLAKTKDQKEKATGFLDGGEWSRAAATVAVEDQGQVKGAAPGAGMRATEPLPPAATRAPGLPQAARAVLISPDTDIDTMLRAAVRAEKVGRWLTTTLSAVVLVLLYFVHYRAKAMHTWPDLLEVFAQAVSIDLGIDAVVQRFKDLAK